MSARTNNLHYSRNDPDHVLALTRRSRAEDLYQPDPDADCRRDAPALLRRSHPKALADRLGLSPSSAKHHLAKLASIGVVLLDHQATIHGIVASYYRLTDKAINLDVTDPAAREFAPIWMRTSAASVQQGLFDSFTRWQNAGAKEEDRWGMLDTDDVVYLTKEEAEALEAAIHAFSAAHSAPRPGAAPIRYNLIAYRAERADEN